MMKQPSLAFLSDNILGKDDRLPLPASIHRCELVSARSTSGFHVGGLDL